MSPATFRKQLYFMMGQPGQVSLQCRAATVCDRVCAVCVSEQRAQRVLLYVYSLLQLMRGMSAGM